MKTIVYGIVVPLLFLFNATLGAMEEAAIKLYWPEGRCIFLTKEKFTIFKNASPTIQHLIDDIDETQEEAHNNIPMDSTVSPENVKDLIRFEEKLHNENDIQFLLKNKSIEDLIKLIKAANYFDMHNVLDALSQKLANQNLISLKEAEQWYTENEKYIEQLAAELQVIVADKIIANNPSLQSSLLDYPTIITPRKPSPIKIFKMASNPTRPAIALSLTNGNIELWEKKEEIWVSKTIVNFGSLAWPVWSPQGNHLVLSRSYQDQDDHNCIWHEAWNGANENIVIAGTLIWGPHEDRFLVISKDKFQMGTYKDSQWKIVDLKNPDDHLEQIFWSPDGNYFISVSNNHMTRLWYNNHEQWESVLLHIRYEKSIDQILWHAESKQFAYISNNSIKIFYATDKKEWRLFQELSDESIVGNLIWSWWGKNGTLILCYNQREKRTPSSSFYVWHKHLGGYSTNGNNPFTLDTPSDIVYSPDENVLWIAIDKSIHRIKITSDGFLPESQIQFSKPVERLLSSNNGNYLVALLKNNELFVLYKDYMKEWKSVQIESKSDHDTTDYTFSADNNSLIVQKSEKYPAAYSALLRDIPLAENLSIYSMPQHNYLSIAQAALLDSLFKSLTTKKVFYVGEQFDTCIPKIFKDAWDTIPTRIKRKILALVKK